MSKNSWDLLERRLQTHECHESRVCSEFHQTRDSSVYKTCIGRIFSGGGCTFFLTKNLMTFFSHHPLLHSHIRYILPPTTFLSHLRGCTSPNSAPFLSHSDKNTYKKFFHRPGVHLDPLHPQATPTKTCVATPNTRSIAVCKLNNFSWSVELFI